MKHKLLLFLLLITTTIYSQSSYKSFQVESDGNIVFKKVFSLKEGKKESLINYLKRLSNFDISNIDNDIEGKIKDMKVNFKKYGKGTGYPIFLRHSLSSDVRIQLKDDRYRVVISSIGFLDDVSLYSLSTYKESDNFTYLTEFYVKNDGTLRSSKIVKKTLDVIENQFIDLFTIKETDDW